MIIYLSKWQARVMLTMPLQGAVCPPVPRPGAAAGGRQQGEGWGRGRALNEGYPKVPEDFTITEMAPTIKDYRIKIKYLTFKSFVIYV